GVSSGNRVVAGSIGGRFATRASRISASITSRSSVGSSYIWKIWSRVGSSVAFGSSGAGVGCFFWEGEDDSAGGRCAAPVYAGAGGGGGSGGVAVGCGIGRSGSDGIPRGSGSGRGSGTDGGTSGTVGGAAAGGPPAIATPVGSAAAGFGSGEFA